MSEVTPSDESQTLWGTEALRAAGYRVTAARRAILEALSTEGAHLTPSQIQESAQRRHAFVNLASTYRNLILFTQLGLVRPLYIGNTQPCYIRNDQPHHHAICLSCHCVLEFSDCAAAETETMVETRYGFQASSHLLEIYGLCRDCNTVQET